MAISVNDCKQIRQRYLNGEKTVVNLFCAGLCCSCRPAVLAYRRQNEESFPDAFVNIFNILGGTTARVIFDNGKAAVVVDIVPTISTLAGASAAI